MDQEPFDLPLDDFLKGVGSTKNLDIDFVFSTPFEEVIEDNKDYIEGYPSLSDFTFIKDSDVSRHIRYFYNDSGVVAVLSDDTIVGMYMWSALCLHKDWQGRGLGRELVVIRCLHDGANPVWQLDTPAYSPAGLASHISAWRSMQ